MRTINELLLVVRMLAIVSIILVVGSISFLNAGQIIDQEIEKAEIIRLTKKYEKAEKEKNEKKMRYILAQLRVQGKIIELGKMVENEK